MEAPLGERTVGRRDRRDRRVQLLVHPRRVDHVVGKHADDAVHTGGKRQRLPEDVRVSAEQPLPQGVREDGYTRSPALLIGREQPSEERMLAEGRKEARRYDGNDDALDAVRAGEPLAPAANIGEPRER